MPAMINKLTFKIAAGTQIKISKGMTKKAMLYMTLFNVCQKLISDSGVNRM